MKKINIPHLRGTGKFCTTKQKVVYQLKSDVLNTRNSVCDLNTGNKGTVISINWHKASALSLCDYKLTLDEYLLQVPIPWSAIKCSDVNCRVHNETIENFIMASFRLQFIVVKYHCL